MKEQNNRSESFDAAYQGAPGAFSEEAALIFIGTDARLLACREFQDVFEAVCDGRSRGGVIPIENTLAGSVHACYDLLNEFELKIVAETVLHVAHDLIAVPGVRFEEIREVRSHPVALAQCENFFRRHPQLIPVSVYDTAGAVETLIHDKRRNAAAIASHRAAEVYGANVLVCDIQDHTENYTRFLFVKSAADDVHPEPGKQYKTTILFKAGNRPGALFECLRPFAERGVDLAKLESRPLPAEPFQYLFYADLIGSTADGRLSEALHDLRQTAPFVRILGSYPAVRR
jgi:prephenate dehydratase